MIAKKLLRWVLASLLVLLMVVSVSTPQAAKQGSDDQREVKEIKFLTQNTMLLKTRISSVPISVAKAVDERIPCIIELLRKGQNDGLYPYDIVGLQEVFYKEGEKEVLGTWPGGNLEKIEWVLPLPTYPEREVEAEDIKIITVSSKEQEITIKSGSKFTVLDARPNKIPVEFKFGRFYVTGLKVKDSGLRLDSGLMLLSQHPIIAVSAFRYSESEGWEKWACKGALYARINLAPGSARTDCYIHVFVTHTQAHDYPTIRTKQFEELKKFIGNATNYDGHPIVLMGDFNVIAWKPKAWGENAWGENIGVTPPPKLYAESEIGEISSVAFSPDGKYLALGSAGGVIELLDVKTGEKIWRTRAHIAMVSSVAFSPDGKYLASGSFSESTIKLLDAKTGEEIRVLSDHRSHVNSVAFSRDGKYLASGSEDKTIKLWNMATGEFVRTLKDKGHTAGVNSVAFSPSGRLLASGSDDNTIKLWKVESGELEGTLVGHEGAVMSVTFDPLDGMYLASGSADRTIKLWSMATRKEVSTLAGHTGSVMSIAFSRDGEYLASGSEDKTIKLWDVADVDAAIKVRTLIGYKGRLNAVTFSPDAHSRYLVSSSGDRTIKLWEMQKIIDSIKEEPSSKEEYWRMLSELPFSGDVWMKLHSDLPGFTWIGNPDLPEKGEGWKTDERSPYGKLGNTLATEEGKPQRLDYFHYFPGIKALTLEPKSIRLVPSGPDILYCFKPGNRKGCKRIEEDTPAYYECELLSHTVSDHLGLEAVFRVKGKGNTFTWTDPNTGGELQIEVSITPQADGRRKWEYLVTNLSYNPHGGNGFSSFNIYFANEIDELSDQFGPEGWELNSCGLGPPNGAAWDKISGPGAMSGEQVTFGFFTAPREPATSRGMAHTWVEGRPGVYFGGDLLVPGKRK